MQKWFEEAKLGIFIHYGIYAVDGVSESWSFYNGRITYDEYMKQLDGFTASKFNAEKWADLIEKSGARYAVLTTKHHDGVALWDTQYSDLNVVKRTPANRDIVRGMRKQSGEGHSPGHVLLSNRLVASGLSKRV